MTDTIIGAIQTYIKTYAGLPTGAPVWIDFMGGTAPEYAIITQPGSRTLETYIDGSKLRAYSFAFQATVQTEADAKRLEASGFFEAFAAWLDAQTEAGVLPTLGTGKTAESVKSQTWGFLFEQGPSGTGLMQIQCQLEYTEAA
jgi:hypothetical protein